MSKISILVAAGNTKRRPGEDGEAFDEALDCFLEVADEVVIVDGSWSLSQKDFDERCKIVHYEWPYEFSWNQLPKTLNTGLAAATGDFVIRCDLDYIFHENDIPRLRKVLPLFSGDAVIDFQKHVFVTKNRYYQKGRVPVCINKKLAGDKVQFGRAINGHNTDLCYPIRVTNTSAEIPYGHYEPELHGKSGIPFYVYDYMFKTEKQTREEFARFARAYEKYFGEPKFGVNEYDSFDVFIDMMKGRLKRCVYKVGDDNSIKSHPKFIKDKILKISKDQFGHSGWDKINK